MYCIVLNENAAGKKLTNVYKFWILNKLESVSKSPGGFATVDLFVDLESLILGQTQAFQKSGDQ